MALDPQNGHPWDWPGPAGNGHPLVPQPHVGVVPSGCSWHSWQHSKMETTQWCISEASSNASGSVQVAEYSGTWEKQEAQRFRVQTREPDSLGRVLALPVTAVWPRAGASLLHASVSPSIKWG